MSCAEFEQAFDQYVDELLSPELMASASRHIACCRACDREVTRWQQTRILLSTAVSDFATAVDVSSLRADVEAALGFAPMEETKRGGKVREADFSRGSSRRGARREAASSKRAAGGKAAAVLRFASAAGVSAIAAGVAVMLLSPQPDATTASPVVASAPAVSAPSRSSFQPASFHANPRSMFNDVAAVAYTPPPLARPEVSHVDGLEVAPGHQASTWVQPRTNARVIWVQDRGMGAPIRMAGLER